MAEYVTILRGTLRARLDDYVVCLQRRYDNAAAAPPQQEMTLLRKLTIRYSDPAGGDLLRGVMSSHVDLEVLDPGKEIFALFRQARAEGLTDRDFRVYVGGQTTSFSWYGFVRLQQLSAALDAYRRVPVIKVRAYDGLGQLAGILGTLSGGWFLHNNITITLSGLAPKGVRYGFEWAPLGLSAGEVVGKLGLRALGDDADDLDEVFQDTAQALFLRIWQGTDGYWYAQHAHMMGQAHAAEVWETDNVIDFGIVQLPNPPVAQSLPARTITVEALPASALDELSTGRVARVTVDRGDNISAIAGDALSGRPPTINLFKDGGFRYWQDFFTHDYAAAGSTSYGQSGQVVGGGILPIKALDVLYNYRQDLLYFGKGEASKIAVKFDFRFETAGSDSGAPFRLRLRPYDPALPEYFSTAEGRWVTEDNWVVTLPMPRQQWNQAAYTVVESFPEMGMLSVELGGAIYNGEGELSVIAYAYVEVYPASGGEETDSAKREPASQRRWKTTWNAHDGGSARRGDEYVLKREFVQHQASVISAAEIFYSAGAGDNRPIRAWQDARGNLFYDLAHLQAQTYFDAAGEAMITLEGEIDGLVPPEVAPAWCGVPFFCLNADLDLVGGRTSGRWLENRIAQVRAAGLYGGVGDFSDEDNSGLIAAL